jgi:hypothetical protein
MSMRPPLQSTQASAKAQRSSLEIAACVLVLAGACLAISGALAPWFTLAPGSPGAVSVGLLQTCSTLPATGAAVCAYNNSPGALAGAACLLLGFIFGFMDFVAVAMRCCRMEAAQHASCAVTRLGLVAASFLFSMVGTVVSSSVQSTGGLSFQQAVTVLGLGWGPAFGCSVAAALLQGVALCLAIGGMCFKVKEEVGFSEREGVATSNARYASA